MYNVEIIDITHNRVHSSYTNIVDWQVGIIHLTVMIGQWEWTLYFVQTLGIYSLATIQCNIYEWDYKKHLLQFDPTMTSDVGMEWGFEIRLCHVYPGVFLVGGKVRARSTSNEHMDRKPCMNQTALVIQYAFDLERPVT